MILLLISVIGVAVFDGIQDNIDHHKGAQGLRDVWHLIKYINRAFTVLTGIAITQLMWHWLLIPAIIILLVFAKLVWDYFYYNYVEFWQRLDNTVKITTGIKWLDKILGFHL